MTGASSLRNNPLAYVLQQSEFAVVSYPPGQGLGGPTKPGALCVSICPPSTLPVGEWTDGQTSTTYGVDGFGRMDTPSLWASR